MTVTDRACSVVDSIECEAPPGYGSAASSIVRCWGCGDDVCRSCSSVVLYPWKGQRRRVRMCFTCQEQRGLSKSSERRRIERNQQQRTKAKAS